MNNFLEIQLHHYLIVSALLFSIGIYGVVTTRNLIKMLMSIEFILNAANINFVAFSYYIKPFGENPAAAEFLTGQVFAIFIMTIAAAEAGVALAIILSIYKHFKSADVDKVRQLKW